jgi:hypothetical protein
MRLTSAILITSLTSVWGLVAGNPYLWIPVTGLIAAVIDLLTLDWVSSSRLGEMQKLSLSLKLVFTLIGTYAILSQFACVILMIYWIIT